MLLKKLSIISVFIFFFSAFTLKSDENNTNKTDGNSNFQKEYGVVSFKYSKIFIPIKESYHDNLINSGNNFLGASVGPAVFITDHYCILGETGIQLGNINGDFAGKVYFLPSFNLWIGYINVGFGAGLSYLTVKGHNIESGGLGSTAAAFVNVNISDRLQAGIGIGSDNYARASYNSFSFDFKYVYK